MLYLIYTRQISVGQFFSLWIYSFFIFGPLQELGTVINIYRETEASLENFQAILATPRGSRSRRAPCRWASSTSSPSRTWASRTRRASAPAL